MQNNQTGQGLHLEGFSESPRFLDRDGAKELLQSMKVVYLTNTLTQRDYELHVGRNENDRLWNDFVFDCTLGATIGPEVGQFFTYEVYKQVKYLFDPKQFQKRKKLEKTIPELRLPRALRLKPLEKTFEKTLRAFTSQEFEEDPFSRRSLPVQLATLGAISYLENMISLNHLKLYSYPNFPRLLDPDAGYDVLSIKGSLCRFIDHAEKWDLDVLSAAIVSGSSDRTLRVWDAATGQCLQTLEGHRLPITCVAKLRDGRVVSGSGDSTLRVWDAATGQCHQTLEGHRDSINCVAELRDGRIVSDAAAKMIADRAEKCRKYIEYVLDDPDSLFSRFEQSAVNPEIYELPLAQNDIDTSSHLEHSLVTFLKKYHNTCTPYYTIDFGWGLSSGEENMLRLFSWLFHIFPRTAEDGGTRYDILNNPKHIYNSGNKCDSVLLIMDEADLTFHPEWQRRLIHILTAFLPTIYPPECAKDLQLVLTTHSPLLLGDIPRENIRFLYRTEDNTQTSIDSSETFGQNIHTILKDSFFLEKGTVGQFASNKINALAKRLKKLQKDGTKSNVSAVELETIRQTIDLVAPGILRTKLEQMYQDAIGLPDAERIAEQAKGLSREDRQWLLRRLQEDEMK